MVKMCLVRKEFAVKLAYLSPTSCLCNDFTKLSLAVIYWSIHFLHSLFAPPLGLINPVRCSSTIYQTCEYGSSFHFRVWTDGQSAPFTPYVSALHRDPLKRSHLCLFFIVARAVKLCHSSNSTFVLFGSVGNSHDVKVLSVTELYRQLLFAGILYGLWQKFSLCFVSFHLPTFVCSALSQPSQYGH